MSWHEQALLEELAEPIRDARASIVLDPSDVLALFFEQFPAGSGIVDWDRVVNKRSLRVLNPSKTRRVVEAQDAIDSFWREAQERGDIQPGEPAWIVFNDLVDFAVFTDVSTLDGLLAVVLDTVPSNALVFSDQLEWAMTYTVQDVVTLGRA